jgi:ketosteroid isomerase-like protein
MIRFVLIVFLISMGTHSFAQNSTKAKILAEMERQTNCWNNGDLDCFMKGYWKSDSLMFIGKSGINYGWKATYDRYKRNYPDQQTMGTLEFKIKEIKELSEDTVFMIGKWQLNRKMGDIGGHFTLIWKSINGRWVIVSDHTS